MLRMYIYEVSQHYLFILFIIKLKFTIRLK